MGLQLPSAPSGSSKSSSAKSCGGDGKSITNVAPSGASLPPSFFGSSPTSCSWRTATSSGRRICVQVLLLCVCHAAALSGLAHKTPFQHQQGCQHQQDWLAARQVHHGCARQSLSASWLPEEPWHAPSEA